MRIITIVQRKWWKAEIVAPRTANPVCQVTVPWCPLGNWWKLTTFTNHPWNGSHGLPHTSAEPRRTPLWRFWSPAASAASAVWQTWYQMVPVDPRNCSSLDLFERDPFLEIYKFDQVWIVTVHFLNNSHTASGGVCCSSTDFDFRKPPGQRRTREQRGGPKRGAASTVRPRRAQSHGAVDAGPQRLQKWFKPQFLEMIPNITKHHCRFGPKYPVEYVTILQCH